mmetsp:Transcript_22715/g.37559  ORF Transcript_22715/g.37559 Transcript_22715/m.37559 type:complete len:194 (+) Transcript_22715:47-628(+)
MLAAFVVTAFVPSKAMPSLSVGANAANKVAANIATSLVTPCIDEIPSRGAPIELPTQVDLQSKFPTQGEVDLAYKQLKAARMALSDLADVATRRAREAEFILATEQQYGTFAFSGRVVATNLSPAIPDATGDASSQPKEGEAQPADAPPVLVTSLDMLSDAFVGALSGVLRLTGIQIVDEEGEVLPDHMSAAC